MKMFFLTVWDFSEEETNGICHKIRAQEKVFLAQGWEVTLGYLHSGNTVIEHEGEKAVLGRNGRLGKVRAHALFLSYIKTKKFDYVYIRYGLADTYLYLLLKYLKKMESKIVVEIPTFPYDAESGRNIVEKVGMAWDRAYRNRLYHYVDRIAAITNEKQIYGIDVLKISNGIDFNRIPRIPKWEWNGTLHMIAVASMDFWHGYDRLIRGMGEYYHAGGEQEICLHMVGEGKETDNYKRLAREEGVDSKIIWHGRMYGKELDDLFARCQVGIDALGLHRKGLYMSSSLKGNEYAARGLPMVVSCEIDHFPSEECQFVHKEEANDRSVDVAEIIKFMKNLQGLYGDEMEHGVRKYAKDKCGMDAALQKVIGFF